VFGARVSAASPGCREPIGRLLLGSSGSGEKTKREGAVYVRGAMTLQAFRNTVGDDHFFDTLQCWTSSHAGETVSTDEFIDVAEAVSGAHLGDLFDAWLFQPSKPVPDAVTEAEPAIAGN
jgi:hypothetical protein